MKKRKTKREKEQALIRKLQKENAELMCNNMKLQETINENIYNKNGVGTSIIEYIINIVKILYEIIVPALILVFTYWVSMSKYKTSYVHYFCWVILVALISTKIIIQSLLIKNSKIKFNVLLATFNDLLKPFISMILGFTICIVFLGAEWKSAKNYALDVASMAILVIYGVFGILTIFVMAHLIYRLRDAAIKIKNGVNKV